MEPNVDRRQFLNQSNAVAATVLAAGTPVTAMVTVHNDGSTPEAYFADARLGTEATVSLAPQSTPTLALPNLAGVVPTYLVPSHTCGWAAPTPRPPSRRTWSTPARASRSP